MLRGRGWMTKGTVRREEEEDESIVEWPKMVGRGKDRGEAGELQS